MKKYINIILVITQISCSSYDFNVDTVTADQLFKNIRKNNSSEYILINVWSTWCLPCVEEFPYIVKLEKQYDAKDLDVVFLSTDWDENALEVKQFLKEQNVIGQHYRKKEGDDENFINSISQSWSGVLPFTGIYDKNLNLKAYWEGKRDEIFFKFKIDSLLLKKG